MSVLFVLKIYMFKRNLKQFTVNHDCNDYRKMLDANYAK